jgi:hypothetical protein
MQVHQTYLNDVLSVLHAAETLDWPDLNRTNFQKILYLCATLAPLAHIDWGYDFTNAPYGPFNRGIHHAADVLVHHGYAELTSLTLQRDSKLRARYRITPSGSREADRICKLQREKKRLDWITLIMKILDIYGPKITTKLAYKEPTFSQMRRQNRGGAIDLSPEDNLSLRLVQTLHDELDDKYSLQLDTLASKLIAYFDYLSTDIGSGVQG